MTVVPLHAENATSGAPPNDVDAEAAVIGAALITDRVVQPVRVDEGLSARQFYRDRHQLIWRAIEQLADRGDAIDTLTVAGYLADRGELDTVGGRAAIDALTTSPPSVSGARSYARRVVDAWRWRSRATAHYHALAAVNERDEDAHAAATARATDVVARAHIDPSPEGARRRFAAAMNEPQLEPLPLPWPTLSRKFRMRPGQTTVLASWTSFGKSWLALELASHAGHHHTGATVWTNEMSEQEVVARYVQRETGISSDDVLDRQGDPADIAIAVKQLPFGVVECPGWPADEIARHIRHVAPGLAVVDHFHQLPGIGKHETAEHAVQVLTSAAAQAGTHLVIVSQLNHQRDKDAERPDPALRDLKSTGALQDLPNNVLLLRRNQESDKESGETWLSDDAVLHVAKQRGSKAPVYQRVFISPPRMRVVEAMFR
jgi:replicative DNA helicase